MSPVGLFEHDRDPTVHKNPFLSRLPRRQSIFDIRETHDEPLSRVLAHHIRTNVSHGAK